VLHLEIYGDIRSASLVHVRKVEVVKRDAARTVADINVNQDDPLVRLWDLRVAYLRCRRECGLDWSDERRGVRMLVVSRPGYDRTR
jgi:hypothetical protein